MGVEFENNPNTESLASIATFTPPASGPATICFWCNVSTFAVNVRQRFMGTETQFEARVENTGIVTNDMYNVSSGAASVTALAVGSWFFIVCTGELDGVPNSITDIYVDGVFEATLTVAGTTAGTATMTIGNRTGIGNTEGFNGILSDLRVYDRELTANEIQTIFQTRGVDGIVNGLILRAYMDEGPEGGAVTGTGVVKDLSDNQNNYTPAGTPTFEADENRSRRRVA